MVQHLRAALALCLIPLPLGAEEFRLDAGRRSPGCVPLSLTAKAPRVLSLLLMLEDDAGRVQRFKETLRAPADWAAHDPSRRREGDG